MGTENTTWIDEAVPTDWIADDPSTWYYASTVEAHLGYHGATGMAIRELREIKTAAVDHAAAPYELQPRYIYSWAHNLYLLHTGLVSIAEASPEKLAQVAEFYRIPDGMSVTDWVFDADVFSNVIFRAVLASDIILGYTVVSG